MAYRVHPFLVNGRFGDPVLYVDLRYEGRGVLFDIGDLTPLPGPKLRQVSDICISHAHMDHFVGFDSYVRAMLWQESRVRMYGPAGIIDHIGHHLAGYSWNLVGEHSADLRFLVTEMVSDKEAKTAEFRLQEGFRRRDGETREIHDGILHEDHDIRLTATALDHRIPCLAFAVEERQSLNILKTGLAALGLDTGPWLDEFKHALLTGAPDGKPIVATATSGETTVLPLSELRDRIAKLRPGRKIAYVVDAGKSPANEARIVALAEGADILFIEAAFRKGDAKLAGDRYHLTTEDAGRIARLAGVRRIEPFHFSLRYEECEEEVLAEVQGAFRRRGGAVNLS